MATKPVSVKAKSAKAPAKKAPAKGRSAVGARSGKAGEAADTKPAAKNAMKTRGRPFQPGNPGGGRPAVPPEVRDACRALTMDAIDTLCEIMRGGKRISAAARVNAAESILNRGWGKPTQPLAGEDGQPIQIATIIRRIVDGAPDAG